MTIKDIKQEARRKLALNMHQAIMIYTVEFAIMITLIALVVMSCVSLGVNTPAAIVMICYGILLGIIAMIGAGMVNFALVDFYLATYRCKPYNIRRLGDTLARSNITKVLLLSLKRTIFAFLLLLCLIVPGVIYLIRTSMANYLSISNPKMKASTALSASNKVMSGKTGAYFSLCMSLIGWYLLGIFTLGLGFIFIMPYTNLVKAVYYKRNLQGDKTVYNTIVQPVVAPDAQPIMSQGTVQTGTVAQEATQNAEPVQQGPAPIDVLADEDFIDMQAAMRDFDTPSKQSVDIPEIPIVPVTTAKPSTTSENSESVSAKNNTFGNTDGLSHKLDGTNIVETERILTTHEIDMSETVQKDAYAKIDGGYVSKRPIVDYISAQSNQSSDDFGTVEMNEPISEMQGEVQTATPVSDSFGASTDSDEPIMSDNEFAEFLKNFDDVPEPEKEFQPLKRSERADTKNRDTENNVFRPQLRNTVNGNAHNADDERRSAGGASAADLADRAARIRKEREERLNKINK